MDLTNFFNKKNLYVISIFVISLSIIALYEKNSNSKILNLALHKDFTELKKIITENEGITLYSKRGDGRTPLHLISTKVNDFSIINTNAIQDSIELILQDGLNVDVRDNFGNSPLHYAVRSGNHPAIFSLLMNGANPNIQNIVNDSTPLHNAAAKGDKKILDILLMNQADPNLINKFGKKPIDYYNLIKEESNEVKKLRIGSKYMYGYFDKNNEVYKIYQPHSKKHKFHKVKPYLQGFDQLKFDKPYLIICSSLKDALCLKGMGYNIEVLAPDSENTMIKPHVIEHLKRKYKKVITLFDNDEAGKTAVNKYNKLYSEDYYENLSSVSYKGAKIVLNELYKLDNEILNDSEKLEAYLEEVRIEAKKQFTLFDTSVEVDTTLQLFNNIMSPDVELVLLKDEDHRFSSPKGLKLIERTLANL